MCDPALRGRPLGIVSYEGGCTCVIACWRVAKVDVLGRAKSNPKCTANCERSGDEWFAVLSPDITGVR